MIFFGKNIPRLKENWNIYIRAPLVLPRLFNIIFSVFDIQGDGTILLTISFLYHAIQFEIPFPGEKYKFRTDWSLFP